MLGQQAAAVGTLDPEAQAVERKFDFLLIWTSFFLLVGGYHIWQMLLSGDWDFWTDWKDRRWWPIVTPIVNIVYPVAVQTVLWQKFRLPFGATMAVLATHTGQWLDRLVNFQWWAGYPINFVFPATWIPGALLLDTILLLTGSVAMTSLFGGLLWGLLFYPTNWVTIGPLHQPIKYLGELVTVADVQGFNYVRTSTPEYLRIVERGNLRSFGDFVTWVSAAFSGFMSTLVYWVGYGLGKALGTTGSKIYLEKI